VTGLLASKRRQRATAHPFTEHERISQGLTWSIFPFRRRLQQGQAAGLPPPIRSRPSFGPRHLETWRPPAAAGKAHAGFRPVA